MHELALAEGIIRIVQEKQAENGFGAVEEITVGLGEYSGVEPKCLEEFFPYAAKGTAAENARLVFDAIPGIFSCRTCGAEGPADRHGACCASCGSTDIKLISGREFLVKSIKVE